MSRRRGDDQPPASRPTAAAHSPTPGTPRSIGEILAKSPSLQRNDAISWWAWVEAVGERVATRSAPDRLDQQTLWVVVEGSAWAAELSLLAPLILQRLQAKKFKVQALRFRVGTVRVPERAPALALPERRAPSPELQARLALLDHDPELKAAILEAAQLCEGRQLLRPSRPPKRLD